MEAGDKASAEISKGGGGGGGGLIVNTAVFDKLFNLAVMVALTGDFTLYVLMSKAREVSPAFTFTFKENFREALEGAFSHTILPPAGAGLLKITVPTEESPPVNEAGDIVNEKILSSMAGIN